jgi:hypothetical protein
LLLHLVVIFGLVLLRIFLCLVVLHGARCSGDYSRAYGHSGHTPPYHPSSCNHSKILLLVE